MGTGEPAVERVVVTKAVGGGAAVATVAGQACEAHERHEQNEHSRRGAPCLKTLCTDWD